MTVVDYERKSRTCGCISPCGCGSGAGCALHGDNAAQGLERTRYYPRQIVTPDDLTQDQWYFGDKLRRHNRLLHGWGIVCGLVVSMCEPGVKEDQPCEVKVSSGYALDPFGNELVLPSDQILDLCKEDVDGAVACVPQSDPWCRPVDSSRGPGPLYLAVRHVERNEKPVHAPNGCSCRDTNCENTRIRDALEFKLLPEKPDHYDESCEPADQRHFCLHVDECPSCPKSGWVILAVVHMAGSSIEHLDAQGCRRHVYSFSRFCIDSNDDAWRKGAIVQSATKRYVGSASANPDSVMTSEAVVTGHFAEISVAVNSADIANKTALEVKKFLDGVQLFDADDPQHQPFSAGLLLAHSTLTSDSVLDGPADLALRLRTPVIDPVSYEEMRATIDSLLDKDGRGAFAEQYLGNFDRLDELDIERIHDIGDRIGDRLRAAGIATLADLRNTDEVPEPDNASADAKRSLADVRKLLRNSGLAPS